MENTSLKIVTHQVIQQNLLAILLVIGSLGEEKRPSPCFQPQELTVTCPDTGTQGLIAQCKGGRTERDEEDLLVWGHSLST